MPLIFDLDRPAVRCGYMPVSDIPDDIPGPAPELLRDSLPLPQVAEPEVVRHFVNLSTLNHHVDKGFYPLGSCTMKYNPKVHEALAALPGFAGLHPHQPESTIQGALQLMQMLEGWLAEITGMDAVTLQPAAGSHGELTGMFLCRAWHESRTDRNVYPTAPRRKVLIPDSAHGTNPASVVMAGFQPVQIPSDSRGRIDLAALKAALSPEVAALMVTNPNTLGLFEDHIAEVAAAVHEVGALLYMDGANMNALVGLARPGDMGFDIVHLNLHKTFTTPHGGGGPGSGPVAVNRKLEPFLPMPRIRWEGNGKPPLSPPRGAGGREKDNPYYYAGGEGKFVWDWDRPQSIGRIHSFYGNFGMLVRAAAYIRALGGEGLRNVSQTAILNANYILARLKDAYKLPYDDVCMHEVVFSADNQGVNGVKAVDIAKRLLDFGFHAPTINFPLVVHQALMIEPTETETKETLDSFCDTMLQIDREARETPDVLFEAPHNTPVARFDEAAAARQLDIAHLPK